MGWKLYAVEPWVVSGSRTLMVRRGGCECVSVSVCLYVYVCNVQ